MLAEAFSLLAFKIFRPFSVLHTCSILLVSLLNDADPLGVINESGQATHGSKSSLPEISTSASFGAGGCASSSVDSSTFSLFLRSLRSAEPLVRLAAGCGVGRGQGFFTFLRLKMVANMA